MSDTVQQFRDRILECGLIDADEFDEFVAALSDSPGDAEELARRFVTAERLTAFQARTVCAGRHEALVLGNYVVQDELGEGGMGQVYKAVHGRMDRVVAVKVLPPAVTSDPEAVQRFQREAKAAARLVHPNIVTAYDADEYRGTHFLVMEYVEGTDLAGLVDWRGPLPVEEAVGYVLQAAHGLGHAHEAGIVHRDVKPSNLLLDGHGIVKVLDMGLARVELGEPSKEGSLTRTGSIMGTIDYMAPEQALDTKTADERSDVYSLGCTLHFLLSARPVYEGDTIMKKLLAHREQQVHSLRGVRDDVPEELDAVYRRMIAKHPGDRPQSMRAVIAELELLAAPAGSSTSHSAPRQPIPTVDMDELPPMPDTAAEVVDAPSRTVAVSGGHSQRPPSTPPDSDSGTLPPSETIAVGPPSSTATVTEWTIDTSGSGGQSRRRSPAMLIGGGIAAAAVILGLVFAFLPRGEEPVPTESAGHAMGNGNDDPKEKDAAPSKPNFALEFDGVDDWVEFPGFEFEEPEQFTVEAYLEPLSFRQSGDPSDRGFVFMLGRRALDIRYSKGGWQYLSGPGKYMVTPRTEPGRRFHFAMCREGRAIRVYHDGRLVRSKELDDVPVSRPRPVVFGTDSTAEKFWFHGRMDEFRVSSTARYQPDFTPSGRLEPDADTIALYHFDSGVGTKLVDASGNGHHGVIHGATWVPADAPSPDPPRNFALDLDGVDDYVEIPGLEFDGLDELTIECTVTVRDFDASKDDRSEFPSILTNTFSGGPGFGLHSTHRDGALVCAIGIGGDRVSSYGSRPLGDGETVHLAAVLAGDGIQLFANGQALGVKRATHSGTIAGPNSLLIGARRTRTGDALTNAFFPGRIDELRISGVARYDAGYEPSDRLEVDADTLALYHFDEGRGTKLVDSSGNGHHGVIHGATWVSVDGPAPVSPPRFELEFDGEDDHVLTPYVYDGSHPITVELWVTPKLASHRGTVLANGDSNESIALFQWGKFLQSRIITAEGAHVAPYTFDLEAGKRIHVAWFWDGTRSRMYREGHPTLKNSVPFEEMPAAARPWIIGSKWSSNDESAQPTIPFLGKIDELRISRGVRLDDLRSPPERFERTTDTILLYHFDEGEGTRLVDASGNGHHGVIHGAKWVRVDDRADEARQAAQRRVAEYVTSHGGSVVVRLRSRPEWRQGIRLQEPGDVPDEPFELVSLSAAKLVPENDRPDPELVVLAEIDTFEEVYWHNQPLKNEELAYLNPNVGLKVLMVQSTHVDDAWAHNLANFPQLERLAVPQQATDETMPHVAKLTKLVDVSVGHRITSRGFAMLAALPRLERLNVVSNLIDADRIRAMRDSPTLRILTLTSPGTRFDPGALEAMAELPHLRHLELSRTRLDDSHAPALVGLVNLEELDVRETGLSREGVDRLHEALPNCRIESDFGVFGGVGTSGDRHPT